MTTQEGLITRNQHYVTPEMRATRAPFVDPLTLNFKIFFDFDKPYGLLADGSNVNSALAYLKRIGETERYEFLGRFISMLKDLNKNYDFMFMAIEGLETIVNAKPQDAFTDSDKIVIQCRESSDMRIQAMLTLYRHIWYDDGRSVEVLPINLRQFDIKVLVYSGGYYNMMVYDTYNYDGVAGPDTGDIDTKIFPTLRKLSDKHFTAQENDYGFNNLLFNLEATSINNEESGKNFFSTVTNEAPTEVTKNNIVLNIKYAKYSGSFNNLIGEFNINEVLAFAAAQNKVAQNITESEIEAVEVETLSFKSYFEEVKKQSIEVGINFMKEVESKPSKYGKLILPVSYKLEQAFDRVTSTKLVPKLLDNVRGKASEHITGFENMVINNFTDGFVNTYSTILEKIKNKPELVVTPTKTEAINQEEKPIIKGISFAVSNIYNRTGF